jgi:hypothetical protein
MRASPSNVIPAREISGACDVAAQHHLLGCEMCVGPDLSSRHCSLDGCPRPRYQTGRVASCPCARAGASLGWRDEDGRAAAAEMAPRTGGRMSGHARGKSQNRACTFAPSCFQCPWFSVRSCCAWSGGHAFLNFSQRTSRGVGQGRDGWGAHRVPARMRGAATFAHVHGRVCGERVSVLHPAPPLRGVRGPQHRFFVPKRR